VSTVYRRYFEVTDEVMVAAAQEAFARVEAMREGANALAVEFGFAAAAIRTHPHTGVSLAGFTQPKHVALDEWRVAGKTQEGHNVYVPRRSRKAGKERDAQMKGVTRVDLHREMKAITGISDFPDAWGAIGSGWGVHYTTATLAARGQAAILVSLPFEKLKAAIPVSLEGATELTEHQYRARFAAPEREAA
jgi:hypothetical protein